MKNEKPNLLIIDLNHIANRYYFIYKDVTDDAPWLAEKCMWGVRELVKYTNADRVIVARDVGQTSRKIYYQKIFGEETEYKGTREKKDKLLYEILDNLADLIHKEFKAPILSKHDYEADDIIFALVEKFRDSFNINVMTNDADLLPLVDKDITVFIFKTSGVRFTVDKYIEFSANTFGNKIEYMRDFRDYVYITYDNLLLVKLLRGDKSDNIPMVKGFPPRKIKELLETLKDKEIDSYTSEWTGPKPYKFILKYGEDETSVLRKLKEILPEDIAEKAFLNYKLMNLNSTFDGLREPYTL